MIWLIIYLAGLLLTGVMYLILSRIIQTNVKYILVREIEKKVRWYLFCSISLLWPFFWLVAIIMSIVKLCKQ